MLDALTRGLGPWSGSILGVLERETATRVLLSLRAKGDGSERARPCLAGAAGGRRVLTAEQERRFRDFGEGHGTILWD